MLWDLGLPEERLTDGAAIARLVADAESQFPAGDDRREAGRVPGAAQTPALLADGGRGRTEAERAPAGRPQSALSARQGAAATLAGR